jgi:hypothetical protein
MLRGIVSVHALVVCSTNVPVGGFDSSLSSAPFSTKKMPIQKSLLKSVFYFFAIRILRLHCQCAKLSIQQI